MKELSIEEKAKRYDIALDKIKMLLGTGSSISREELKYVFPELKESEDERIRKELIEFVKSRGGFKQEYIAWLEKQGKNNIGISESTKQELEDNLNNALEKETPESCNEFLEKQCEQKSYASETMNEKGDFDSGFTRMMEKEQKPAFEMITPEESLAKSEDEMIRKDLLYWLYSYKDGNETFVPAGDVDVWISYLEKQGEQNGKVEPIEGEFPYNNPADTLEGEINNIWKNVSCDNRFSATKEGFEEVIRHFVNFVRQKPAWSKEDETMITDLSVIVHTYFSEISGIPFKYDLSEDKIRTWLKALKDRVLPQPNQEWSDEDNEHIKSIISTIECSKAQFPNSPAVLEAYNSDLIWLKSLRPQKQWKPSEEQMLAINTAINVLGKGTLNGKQLIELQEQLKIIREK